MHRKKFDRVHPVVLWQIDTKLHTTAKHNKFIIFNNACYMIRLFSGIKVYHLKH
jgi:hypothetical protein